MSTPNTTLPSVPFEDCDPLLDSLVAKVIKTAAYSILLLLSLIGNSMVPAVVYRNPELHNSVNYFIASMSISDMLLPIFALPERIKQIYVSQAIWQIDGAFGSIVCKFRAFVVDSSYIVTVLSLIIVSFERFFAVIYPFKIQPLRSKKACFVAIAFTWVLAMLYSSQSFYTWRLTTDSGKTYCIYSWEPAFNSAQAREIEYIVFQVCFSIIPFVVLSGLYSSIIISLWRNKAPGRVALKQRRQKEKKYQRITSMLLTVVALFLVPQAAVNIYAFLSSFVWTVTRPCSNRHVTFVLVYLSFTYQAFNPYIYCIFNTRFKKGFEKLLCCGRRCDFGARPVQDAIELNPTCKTSSSSNNNEKE